MIPDGWKRGLMGEVIKLISGQHVEAQFYNEDRIGIPYLTGPSDFQDGIISVTKYTEQPKVLCEAGDILITVKGSGTGKSIIANQKCCIGRQLMAIRATGIDRTFAFYIIQSREAKYGDAASGLIPGIAREHILETSLLIPPFSEQCRIAEILGAWDEAIDLLEKLVASNRSRKQGLMQQLLTGKKRFKEFEGSEWETVRLKDISIINYGKSPKNIFCDDGKFPVYGTGGITGYTSTHIYNGESVIIGRKGTIDKVRYVTGRFWAIDTTYYLECKETAKAKWVYYFLSLANLAELNEASGVPSLNRDTLYAIKFNLPPLPEQEKIAAVLSTADEEIATLEKQLAAYKRQKIGLMQQLLTGHIRI
jgi:type I restriction enzyme, S subunit